MLSEKKTGYIPVGNPNFDIASLHLVSVFSRRGAKKLTPTKNTA